MTRKQFLLSSAAFTLTGCADLRPHLRTLEPETGPFRTPVSDSVDLASHLLSRLTFGPRGGDYARVAQLGANGFIEEQLTPESIDDSALESAIARIESLSSPPGEM